MTTARKASDAKAAERARVEAWRRVLVAQTRITGLLTEEMRASTGVTLGDYDVLLHTHEAGDAGIRMTDLASNLVVSKSGLTTRVDRLEQRGLLQRVADPEDRRATRITLTSDGTTLFRAAAEVHLAGIQEHFGSQLSDRETEQLLTLFTRILESLQQ